MHLEYGYRNCSGELQVRRASLSGGRHESVAAMISAMLPVLIVAMMRRAENGIYRQLSDANAYTPDSAIALSSNRFIEVSRPFYCAETTTELDSW